MRGLSRSRARGALGLAAFCVLGAACILAANVAIVGGMTLALGLADGDDAHPEASEVSEALVGLEGAYALPENLEWDLRDHGCWAMLVDGDSRVAWGLDVPDDVPSSYTPADIASFARWYLDGYPVSCWRHGDGLVVVGSPRGSAWKYSITSSYRELGGDMLLVAAVFFGDLAVLVALARTLSRRSWKQRDDARNEWVAAVSHDVRTPLAAIVADAAALAESPRLDEGERRRAERIVAKTGETAAFLGDLNAANSLRFAMEPIRAADVHLAAVLRSTVAGFVDGGLEAYELELDVAPAAEGLRVRGDGALLGRIASNLISNSIRHNPQGCRIAVSLDARAGLLGTPLGRRCVLSVSDDGRGFGPETLSTLRRRPGDELPEHGLGLVIVRRIALAHGGRASFANDAGGRLHVHRGAAGPGRVSRGPALRAATEAQGGIIAPAAAGPGEPINGFDPIGVIVPIRSLFQIWRRACRPSRERARGRPFRS